MEQRGIRTEKGDLNRWIKATNRMLQVLKKKLASLNRWIDGIQIELKEHDTKPKPGHAAQLTTTLSSETRVR